MTCSEGCPHQKWEGWFAQLGDVSALKEKVPTGVTSAVLCLLKYGSKAQLAALAKLAGTEEGFDDTALLLEAKKRLRKVLEKAYETGEAREEEVLNGVPVIGDTCMWVDEYDESEACFERAKEWFVCLLGEGSAKVVNAGYSVASQIKSDDEQIVEFRRLWGMERVSLLDEAVTYDVATSLGCELH